MSGLLYFNGTDAATLGFTLVDAPELLAGPTTDYQMADVPRKPGVLISTSSGMSSSRRLRITGYVTGNSLSNATATLDTLKSVVSKGIVEIKTGWDTARQWYGVLVESPAGPNSAFWSTYLTVELEFLLFDPFAYATTTSTVNFTNSATAIPLGTAPSTGQRTWGGVITITGAASVPILTYKNYAGSTLATMSFTGYSPLSGDLIEINLGTGLVRKRVSGVYSNTMGALAAGWDFPAIDPNDGTFSASQWPTLEVSSGSGSITYRKAYR